MLRKDVVEAISDSIEFMKLLQGRLRSLGHSINVLKSMLDQKPAVEKVESIRRDREVARDFLDSVHGFYASYIQDFYNSYPKKHAILDIEKIRQFFAITDIQ